MVWAFVGDSFPCRLFIVVSKAPVDGKQSKEEDDHIGF